MGELTPAVRKALKARAHRLDPVVRIGDKGLAPQVLAEIDRALNAHELIKISARAMERGDREAAMREICVRTGARAVQHIGKVLVVYREKPAEPALAPERKPERAARPTRSARPGSRSASRRPASAPRPRRRPPSRSGRARSGN